MTWLVEATYGAGTVVQKFDDLRDALVCQIGMLACGYETSEPQPVGQGRHLTVINGGRGESCEGQAPAAKGL